MSLSAHKMGGPKGIGALLIRDGFEIEPFIRGGGQERRRRAGTENVAAIAGFGAAAEAASKALGSAGRVELLRATLEREAQKLAPQTRVIGAGARQRLPNTSCLALPGVQAETIVIKLDLEGIAVSAGAACSSGKVGPSRTLAAMGLPADTLRGAIRISLGGETSEAEVAHFLSAWAAIAAQRKEPRMVA
jgi:cysteine desulfurase